MTHILWRHTWRAGWGLPLHPFIPVGECQPTSRECLGSLYPQVGVHLSQQPQTCSSHAVRWQGKRAPSEQRSQTPVTPLPKPCWGLASCPPQSRNYEPTVPPSPILSTHNWKVPFLSFFFPLSNSVKAKPTFFLKKQNHNIMQRMRVISCSPSLLRM